MDNKNKLVALNRKRKRRKIKFMRIAINKSIKTKDKLSCQAQLISENSTQKLRNKKMKCLKQEGQRSRILGTRMRNKKYKNKNNTNKIDIIMKMISTSQNKRFTRELAILQKLAILHIMEEIGVLIMMAQKKIFKFKILKQIGVLIHKIGN